MYQQVLDFWFGSDLQSLDALQNLNRRWFGKDPAFDADMQQRFSELHLQAAAGELDAWAQVPESCLALIVLLDQFSRNLYRGSASAFAQDAKALALAKQALAKGFDQQSAPAQRLFFYLPYEHSEELADQRLSEELTQALADAMADSQPEIHKIFEGYVDYARRHREVIERFGRFPHRNASLGRESTPEELAYLSQPGAGF